MAPAKNSDSKLASNLRHLRNEKGFTLAYLAGELKLGGKTSYQAYEEGRAVPDIFKILRLASIFNVSVEELVYHDLTKSKPEASVVRLYDVEKVSVAASAGYQKGFGDQDYIAALEKIQIPYKPYGVARAFEIAGDSMEPLIANRSTVVAIRTDRVDIKNNKPYIVVTRDGLQCKNIMAEDGSEFVYLLSQNPNHAPRHIRKMEVLELWEVWKIL